MKVTRGSYSSPRQQARQERVLSAARALIAEKGYDGLTMRGLARASGVSDATLYNLFGTKDRLIMRAVADVLEGIVDGVQALEQASGLATILSYVDALGAQILQNPVYAQAMSKALFQAGADSPIVDVLLDSNGRFLRNELHRASQSAEIDGEADLAASATQAVGHLWGTVLMWDKGGLSLEKLPGALRHSMQLSLSAIVNDNGRARIASQARLRVPEAV